MGKRVNSVQFCMSLKKLTRAYLFQIAPKSCDYLYLRCENIVVYYCFDRRRLF